jgi:ribosome-associated protein
MNSPSDPPGDPPPDLNPPTRWSTDAKVLEKEVEWTFIRGSGPGGQHRNKVETGVRLVHPPSGITIVATASRSQKRNREEAMARLIEKLRALNFRPRKRYKTKPTRGSVTRRLESKKRRSDIKSKRGKIED